MRLLVAILFTAAGCLNAQTTTCADGRVCPAGTACDEIHRTCVLPDQLTSCADLQPGDECAIGGQLPGRCLDGICVDEGCGDGVALGSEECDLADLRGNDDCQDLD